MLHIRIKNNDEKVLTDVHKEFAKLDFKNTSINSKLLIEIEGGTYKDILVPLSRPQAKNFS